MFIIEIYFIIYHWNLSLTLLSVDPGIVSSKPDQIITHVESCIGGDIFMPLSVLTILSYFTI